MTAGKQLKTKRLTLSKTQEADQRLLENIKKMISYASNVISNTWVYNCIKQFVAECFIVLVILPTISLHSPIFVLPYSDEQLLDNSFSNSGQTVSDSKNNPTATQLNFN
jgi:hypothetical protein